MPEIYVTPVQTFKTILKYEGIHGLYKGLSSPFFAQFALNSITFSANAVTSRFLEPDRKRGEAGSLIYTFMAGSFGGFAQCLVLCPTDLVKCRYYLLFRYIWALSYLRRSVFKYRLQIDQVRTGSASTVASLYKGPIDCAYQIYQKNGIRGLYVGLSATCFREVPSFGIYFSVYATMVEFLTPVGQSLSTPSILLAGGLAGSTSWASVYPVDVVKTYMQVNSMSSSSPILSKSGTGNISFTEMAIALHKKYGLRVFFHGLGTTIVRAFPVNAACFFFYESFRDLCEIAPPH